jgi:hypothetical protein
MGTVKRAAIVVSALAAVLLSSECARAQAWFGRPVRGWRSNVWWPYPYGDQFVGGEVVGTVPFAAGRAPAMTMTAAQYNQLVAAQLRQTPTITAAQWNQRANSQVQLPPPVLTPWQLQQQRLNALRAAQQQQPNVVPQPPMKEK